MGLLVPHTPSSCLVTHSVLSSVVAPVLHLLLCISIELDISLLYCSNIESGYQHFIHGWLLSAAIATICFAIKRQILTLRAELLTLQRISEPRLCLSSRKLISLLALPVPFSCSTRQSQEFNIYSRKKLRREYCNESNQAVVFLVLYTDYRVRLVRGIPFVSCSTRRHRALAAPRPPHTCTNIHYPTATQNVSYF